MAKVKIATTKWEKWVDNNDIPAITRAIHSGLYDFNSLDISNACMQAAKKGHTEIFSLTFHASLSVYEKIMDSVDYLRRQTTTQAFSLACEAGQTGMLQFLQNTHPWSEWLDRNIRYEAFNIYGIKVPDSTDSEGYDNLAIAVFNGHIETVEYLTRGQEKTGFPAMDINQKNGSLLIHAAFNRDENMLDFLIFDLNIEYNSFVTATIHNMHNDSEWRDRILGKLEKREVFLAMNESLPVKENIKKQIKL